MTARSVRGAAEALPVSPAPEWTLPADVDGGVVEGLAADLSLPPALCELLVRRNLADAETAKRFLRPRLEDLPSLDAWSDLDVAARRILQAVRDGETVLVHGDYDVDGICAAALLTLWLRHVGGRVVPFVPHRLRDGYDLGPAGLRAAEEAGASLIVTCDSGILAHEAVDQARELGIDVVITDHHTPGSTVPAALAVVNPKRPDCGYSDPDPCGAGVAFQLCRRLAGLAEISEDDLWPHLDLVALATVADLVPLTGGNRILVRFGLRALAQTRKPGLRALMEVAGIEDPARGLDAGQVGFVLAPRINAAGRVGDAGMALDLLLTSDPSEAGRLARVLETQNRERQDMDRKTLDEALEQLARTFDPERDFGVVLAHEGWHPGVIGIVASRVVERIHRPVVLIALDGDRGRGSARSIPRVHLFEALEGAGSHLLRFGGHRQAAGMDISRDQLPAFREAFNQCVRDQLEGRHPRPWLAADLPLSLAEATDDLHRWLEYVGPFGIGNPRPVFWARDVWPVGAPRTVGGTHLKLRLSDGEAELDAIGFGMAVRTPPEALEDGPLEVLFHLRDNVFRGRRSLQARLVDLRSVNGEGSP